MKKKINSNLIFTASPISLFFLLMNIVMQRRQIWKVEGVFFSSKALVESSRHLSSMRGMNPAAGSSPAALRGATWAAPSCWRSPSQRRSGTQPPGDSRRDRTARLWQGKKRNTFLLNRGFQLFRGTTSTVKWCGVKWNGFSNRFSKIVPLSVSWFGSKLLFCAVIFYSVATRSERLCDPLLGRDL